VARAIVHLISKPGHKVVWMWESFEDLREKHQIVAELLEAERAKEI
jgi:hypothetical protein